MAIAYFPEIYEDELIYSVLSRYYAHEGYLVYRDAAASIFQNKYTNPSIEFINKLTPDFEKALCNQKPMQELIEKHTMFPMYMRFYPKDRREHDFKVLVELESNKNIFPRIAYKGRKRYLRFCPLCAKEDKERLGETYWHRSHQLWGIDICFIHHCELMDSNVLCSGNSPGFIDAESQWRYEVKMCDNAHINLLSEYMVEVFQYKLDMEQEYDIGEYLSKRLCDDYLSEDGTQRKLKKLYEDYDSYFKMLDDNYKIEMEQLHKLFGGKRYLMHEICQIALFEKISVSDLMHQIKSKETQNPIYIQVAKELKLEYELVKLVGETIIKQNNRKKQNSIKEVHLEEKWRQIDIDTLPLIEEVIDDMYNMDSGIRPKRVCITNICRRINITNKKLNKLPKCKEKVLERIETQEHYWARESIWAMEQMQSEGISINWKHFRVLTNMRKCNLEVSMSYLEQIAPKWMLETFRCWICKIE